MTHNHSASREGTPSQAAVPPRPASYDKAVALVLQGGGALGSYQAGVYEAIAETDYRPDWVAGISIGAINAAIIAGNAPHRRVEQLRAFWDLVTEPASPWAATPDGNSAFERAVSAWNALTCGQRGFFTPQPPLAWLPPGQPTSYYDTGPLRTTLERLVDFDRINAREMRFSVGSVNVRTGNFAYFDNAEIPIRVEHVMASGALPPGFPAVAIGEELYWDGGLVSNTPLEYVVQYYPRRSRLCFQVDVFPARGPAPETMDDVIEREKDIRYSSRTRAATDHLHTLHDIRHNINTLWEALPEDLRALPAARYLADWACVTTMDIAQLIYRPRVPQGGAKDYEFGRPTMLARWAQGLADARTTLAASPWLAPAPPQVGVRTFDVLQHVQAADAV